MATSVIAEREAGEGVEGYLPPQPTPLIGRAQELAALRDRFAPPDVRLLTLTGPAGSGKTRLAVALAAEMHALFADGAWFVDLAPVTDPAQVLAAVVRALGLADLDAVSPRERLERHLADRSVLLVLDNFEQVLDAAPAVGALLGACPGARVLATSRAPLRLRWEHEAPIPPLALPDLTRADDPAALGEVASVELFAARARALSPTFELNASNARAVAELCVRLDGLPLAIELAAALVKAVAPRVILERLAQRMDVLATAQRDLPSRHHTLRAAIDWSHDLLAPAARVLFRRLGVFVGGWTLEAAERVCADESVPVGDVVGLLAALVEQSLVVADPVGDDLRYRFLETVRRYALDQLGDSGEAVPLWNRHLRWMVEMAESAAPELRGREQARWLDALERELHNLRAALGWAVESGEAEGGLRLAGALWGFWDVRGHLSEGRDWLGRLLSLDRARPATAARARALDAAGYLAVAQGDAAAACAAHEESIPLWRELGDDRGLALALLRLGVVMLLLRDYERAEVLLDESLALARAAEDATGTYVTLFSRAELARCAGDFTLSATLHEEGLALKRAAGDRWHTAHSLLGLGYLAWNQADPGRARRFLRESLQLFRDVGDQRVVGGCLEALACVESTHGSASRAARLFGAAEALRARVGAAPPPFYRLDYQRGLDAARARLGEAGFQAAWTAGRSLDRESAFACALAEDEAPLESSQAPSAWPADLTPREREVAALLARRLTNREIAEALVISEQTAETHVKRVLAKLGFTSRRQVSLQASVPAAG